MTNSTEGRRSLKGAADALNRAEKIFGIEEYVSVTQNAQLCIEPCGRAIIAYFEEPDWTHDPSRQLLKALKRNERELLTDWGQDMLEDLKRLADDIRTAAPWHVWSTYGKDTPEGWKSATELCTKDAAEDLLARARHSFKTASRFFELIAPRE